MGGYLGFVLRLPACHLEGACLPGPGVPACLPGSVRHHLFDTVVLPSPAGTAACYHTFSTCRALPLGVPAGHRRYLFGTGTVPCHRHLIQCRILHHHRCSLFTITTISVLQYHLPAFRLLPACSLPPAVTVTCLPLPGGCLPACVHFDANSTTPRCSPGGLEYRDGIILEWTLHSVPTYLPLPTIRCSISCHGNSHGTLLPLESVFWDPDGGGSLPPPILPLPVIQTILHLEGEYQLRSTVLVYRAFSTHLLVQIMRSLPLPFTTACDFISGLFLLPATCRCRCLRSPPACHHLRYRYWVRWVQEPLPAWVMRAAGFLQTCHLPGAATTGHREYLPAFPAGYHQCHRRFCCSAVLPVPPPGDFWACH